MLYIASCVTMLLLVVSFAKILRTCSYRQAIAIGLLLTTVTTFFDLLLVIRWNTWFNISDYLFVLVTNLFEDFIHTRYIIIANMAMITRVVPHSVEATVFALLSGMLNLGFGVFGSLFGNQIAALF
jgi:hypothetical protein